MNRILIVLLAFALTLSCSTVFAMDVKMQKGASEVAVFMSIEESESSASGMFAGSKNFDESKDVDLRYGYFLTDGLQIGVSYMAMVSKSWSEENGIKDPNSDSKMEIDFLYLDLKYNFIFAQSQVVIPYVGVGVGTASTKMTSKDYATGMNTTSKGDGTSTALMAGLKFFVTESTSLNLELRMDEFEYEPSIPGEIQKITYTTETTGINLGLSVYF